MKKFLSMLSLMLVASALVVSCSTDETIDNTPVIKTMTRTINIADTRSAVDTDGTIHFTDTEYFTPFVWTGDPYSNLTTAVKLLRGEGGAVTVTHAVDESAVSYKYGFVSPASNKASFDGENYTVTLPQYQQPAADGSTYDAKADVLVSQLLNIDAEATGEAETKFKRMFTFVKVTLPLANIGLKDVNSGKDLVVRYSQERLKGFEIKTLDGTPLTGVATIPATDVADDCVATITNGNASVMATFDEDIDFKAERTIWLVVNPATFTGLQMTLYTQSGEYTRTFETFECEFKPNTINKLTFKHNGQDGDAITAINSVVVDGVRYEQTASVSVKATATDHYGLATVSNKSDLNVLFLNKESATYDFSLKNTILAKDVVFVGNNNKVDANEKVCLKIVSRSYMCNPDGVIAFKNLKIDVSEMTQETAFRFETRELTGQTYLADGNYAGGIKTLIFEDCDIYFDRYNFISAYNSTADMGIERIVIRNCRIIYTADEEAGQLNNKTPQFFAFNNITATGAEKFKEIIVENSVFHWTNFSNALNSNNVAGVVPFTIFNHNTKGVAFKNMDVVFNNNTLVDVVGNSTNAVLMFGGIVGERSLNSLEMKRNVVYTKYKNTYPTMVALRYLAVNDWSNFVIPVNENLAWLDGELDKTGVKTYYAKENVDWVYDTNNNKAFKEVATATDLLPNITYDESGVSSGSYEVGASYAGYGSTLK